MKELEAPRSRHAIACLGNLVYLFGGYRLCRDTYYSPASDTLLVYDPCMDTWHMPTQLLPMPTVEMGITAVPHRSND
ncbi:unnamed protein product [Protopolystoma xenopodis]|uniref:Uncharacterized protein n=1 Tax=Protopolystoma xenopodis TaxID=117903 RepID=A0A3S5ACD9_9PLAT|nr:unnamed protein product [Protopolystoma xenopodis]